MCPYTTTRTGATATATATAATTTATTATTTTTTTTTTRCELVVRLVFGLASCHWMFERVREELQSS